MPRMKRNKKSINQSSRETFDQELGSFREKSNTVC